MLREITANQFGPDDQNVFDIRDGHAFRLSRAFHSIARFLGCNQLASKAEKITNKKYTRKKRKKITFEFPSSPSSGFFRLSVFFLLT